MPATSRNSGALVARFFRTIACESPQHVTHFLILGGRSEPMKIRTFTLQLDPATGRFDDRELQEFQKFLQQREAGRRARGQIHLLST